MPDAVMSLQYEGPAVDAGTMDVRALAPALIATADAVREAHALLEISGPAPRVEVRATRPGSFIVDLLIAEGADNLYQRALAIFTSAPVTADAGLMTLIATVVGSVNIVKRIRNRKISRTEQSPNDVTVIILEDGTRIEVPTTGALRLVVDADFRRSLRLMVEPLSGDKGVTRLTLRDGDQAETVTGDDLPAFDVPPAREEDLGETDTTVVLRPVNVAFTEGNKWRFSDGDATFFAAIEDLNFLTAVNLGTERFAKNDMLRVQLRTRQTRDESGLHVERGIVRVIQHISGTVQLDLFAQDDEPASDAGSGEQSSEA
ncbi:MAG: hypothetical protein ACRDPY_21495 [Streptosporangiaceae bacterium]